jgi:hypothetical protein
MPVVAVSVGIPHTSLVILPEAVLIMPSVDILGVMVHMSNLPTLQIQMPPEIITTAQRGM